MAQTVDYQSVARQIIEVVGGAENVLSAAHCATRLRLIVKNQEIIDDKKVESLPLVFYGGAVPDHPGHRRGQQGVRRSN